MFLGTCIKRFQLTNVIVSGKVDCHLCRCVKGVVYGITGIVTQPVEGAKQEGVTGFFKG